MLQSFVNAIGKKASLKEIGPTHSLFLLQKKASTTDQVKSPIKYFTSSPAATIALM